MRTVVGGLICFLAGVGVTLAVTQPRLYVQAAQAAPAQSGRVEQFENDAVHVWRTTIVPHGPLAMHRHDHPRIAVALKGGTMAFIGADGSKDVQQWETGKAYLLPAMPPGAMHSDVNAGDQPVEVMMIELKHEK